MSQGRPPGRDLWERRPRRDAGGHGAWGWAPGQHAQLMCSTPLPRWKTPGRGEAPLPQSGAASRPV